MIKQGFGHIVQAFENLSQAWKLGCDGLVNEAEHEEDLRMILWHEGTRERTVRRGALCLLHLSPPRPASNGEKEEIMALERSAAAGYQIMMNAFITG